MPEPDNYIMLFVNVTAVQTFVLVSLRIGIQDTQRNCPLQFCDLVLLCNKFLNCRGQTESCVLKKGVNVLFMAQQHILSQGLIIGASRSYSGTQHSAVLPWRSDQLVAETSTGQHTTHTRDIRASGGIRTCNPSKRAAADPRFRPRIRWDRLKVY